MKKEFYKTEDYGAVVVKYWVTPNLDNEKHLFGFDIEINNKPICQWNNCIKNCSGALLESDTDSMHQVDECLKNCIILNLENPEDNIEEYPEDFEIKPTNNR